MNGTRTSGWRWHKIFSWLGLLLVLGAALGLWFLVNAVRREQIVTPAWMRWIAGRLRRQRPDPVELPAPPPSVTPPSAA